MQYTIAIKLQKVLNNDLIAHSDDEECKGLFASVFKSNRFNLKIIDDWNVGIFKEGSCGDCLGGGCFPPQKPNCPANDPCFPLNIFTASICSICKLPIFRKLESADKKPDKIDGKLVCEDCFKKAEGEIIENNGGLGYVPSRVKK